ncbi:hypothetical protein HW555_011888 [Spodoptera exigua]|uniref:Major facilitator superfamily (MFS) profile domain-containing protein n=1 Tax=Spodoptera exigua TaxID=7107 RepID=A0A835KYG0_SPOEX|nr:hypothetical protein HW555_011888 [Spodoptera exigua]
MTLNVTEAENVDNVPKKGKTYVQVLVAIVANTTILTYGFQAGWVSPTTKVLQSENSPSGYPLSDYEISWIASAICLAAMFGVSLFTYIVDKYGRRVAILLTAALQAISWILKLSSAHVGVLITARLFAGLGAGGCYNVVPMYVREISQDDIRGVLGSFIILFHNSGILAMFAMGANLNYYTVLWIVVWVPVLTIILMIKAPESPAFLVKTGKIDEAAKTIAFLRRLDVNDKTIQTEIEYMKNQEVTYASLPKLSFKSLYQNKAWRRGFILNIILMTLRSNSGNMAVLNYAPAILKSAGVTWNPELQMLSFPAVMILASFISMSCVEKFGRKPIITISFAVAVLSHIILATTMLIQHQGGSTPGWLPVLAIVTFFAFFAGGISPMPYIIMTEMFNFQQKRLHTSKGDGWSGDTCVVHVICRVTLSFTAIADFLGTYSVVYIYAGLNLVGVIVSFHILTRDERKDF